MNDTSENIEKRYYAMLMKRSGQERLKMGALMYDAAKEIVKSSIVNDIPGIRARGLKEKFFLRFYALDFSEYQKEKIINKFNGSSKAKHKENL